MKKLLCMSMLVLGFTFHVTAQDSVLVKQRVLYQIPASSLTPVGDKHAEQPARSEKSSVISCDTDLSKRKAVLTTVSQDGLPVKETFVIKQQKK